MSFLTPTLKGSIVVGRGNGFVRLPVGPDGNILKADSGATPGLSWTSQPAFSARFPIWMFGNGADGNLTLGSDTVLAAETPMARYINLNLNGFSLENAASGIVLIIYVQQTLTLAGGEIRGGFHVAAGAGGAKGGTSAGDGGNGGRGRSGVWVFAQTIEGTGRIHSDGEKGQNGAAGAQNSAATAQAIGSGGSQNAETFYLQGLSQSVSPGNVGNAASATPTGAAGGSGTNGIMVNGTVQQWKDHLANIFNVYPVSASFATPIAPDNWGRSAGPGVNGSGGAGGNRADGNTGSGGTGEGAPGGAAGSPGFGASGSGGTGGDGNGQDVAATSGASSGGSGGGGASGGFVCVFTNSAPSTLTVSANGGDGGVGGAGVAAVSGRESGGAGGGGGGGGGITIFAAQSGSGATATVDGGGAGSGGAAGGGGSTAGAPGATGDPGVLFDLTYN